MKPLRKLLSMLPVVKYLHAVEAGIEQEQEEIKFRSIVTDIHARRANYYFYEKNGVTPLVTSLLRGDYR